MKRSSCQVTSILCLISMIVLVGSAPAGISNSSGSRGAASKRIGAVVPRTASPQSSDELGKLQQQLEGVKEQLDRSGENAELMDQYQKITGKINEISRQLQKQNSVARVQIAKPDTAECFSGSLTNTDRRFNRPNTSDTGSGVSSPCSLSATGTNVFFDAYEFSLTRCSSFPTNIIITLCDAGGCALEDGGFDSVIYLYRTPTGLQHPFNKNNPCNNLVAANDDLSGNAVAPGGSSGGLTACSINPMLSGIQRTINSGEFVVVVAGSANATLGDYKLFIDVPDATCSLLLQPVIVSPTLFDFDFDARADLSVFRPTEGKWIIVNSFLGTTTTRFFGSSIDFITPADFDGDGRTDLAVWRHEVGLWFISNSSNGLERQVFWGVEGDIPVPADYDGDFKADIAVWRPSNGSWYIINSSGIPNTATGWGMSGDVPAPGDYDGDHKTDLAVFRPSTGDWLILNSSNGSTQGVSWGVAGDKVVPGDYDGDGKSDIAVWRPSTGDWFIINSSDSSPLVVSWGVSTDIPVPADYDGDGKTDIAVFRPSIATWFIINSSSGTVRTQIFGMNGDVPVPSAYVR
ncbi:MAG: VCBS repeat-containing protein [Blastocatellia bacterium]